MDVPDEPLACRGRTNRLYGILLDGCGLGMQQDGEGDRIAVESDQFSVQMTVGEDQIIGGEGDRMDRRKDVYEQTEYRISPVRRKVYL